MTMALVLWLSSMGLKKILCNVLTSENLIVLGGSDEEFLQTWLRNRCMLNRLLV